MRFRARIAGTPIVYMTTAVMVGIVGWLALAASNRGVFPFSLGSGLLMAFGPSIVAGVLAHRYWHHAEFNPRLLTFLPLLLLALLVVVLALTSLLIIRPVPAAGQLSPPFPRATQSPVPALPPVPAKSAVSNSGEATHLVGSAASGWDQVLRSGFEKAGGV